MTRHPYDGQVGIMLPREVPPDRVVEVARACEAAGFDEVWVVEDCFFTGGLTTAALTLAATSRVAVGIGILPAVVRNAAFTAMEVATLAGAFPGRVHLGLGHGMPGWMEQVGARPDSWLRSLEEVTTAVRDLLHGRQVTTGGQTVRLDDVALVHPPATPPLLSLGVRGPRSVALAARVADGLVLAEPGPVPYVRASRERLGAGRLTVYSWALAGDQVSATEADAALGAAVRSALRHGLGPSPHPLGAHGEGLDENLLAQAADVASGGTDDVGAALLDALVLRGSDLEPGISARHAAGADSVVLTTPRAVQGVDVVLADVAGLARAARLA